MCFKLTYFFKLKIFNLKLLLVFIAIFAIFLKNLIFVQIPSQENPLLLVCNQMQKDLKVSILKSLKLAKFEIVLSVYTLSDPDFIKALNAKADEGITTTVITDKKFAKQLSLLLNPKIKIQLLKQKGLMHHKIFVFDDICYLGSANLTSQSLRMHDNMMLCLYKPALARFLKTELLNSQQPQSSLQLKEFKFFFLPSQKAFETVLELIKQAQESIEIAMFTFTHPQILIALIEAKNRGVKVTVIFDYLSHKGASKKMAISLKEAGFKVYHNRGMQLMHHKFALIDNKKLIMGSTNWTKSGFGKNNEMLLVCSELSKNNLKFIQKMWSHLLWEGKTIEIP